MTNSEIATEIPKSIEPKNRAASPVSKSGNVRKLLARSKGATVADLTEATGWQPHSVRALLSGMRKKGIDLARDARKSGESSYRIVASQRGERARLTPALVVGTPDTAPVSVASAAAAEVA